MMRAWSGASGLRRRRIFCERPQPRLRQQLRALGGAAGCGPSDASAQARTHGELRAHAPYVDWDRAHLLHPYTSMTDPLPTYPVRGAQGVHIELANGQKLIDGMSSWWAAVHGYRQPALDAAVHQQLDKMAHVMFGGLCHEPAARLGRKLVEMAPAGLDKVFLSDSGSVAVEVAMKMAVQFWYTVGKPRKSKFISLTSGYHGDTFGAMSVCDPVNGMHAMFRGVLAEQMFVPAPDGCSDAAARACGARLRAALEQRGDEVAAVIMEPVVQGAGGMRVFSPELLRIARQLCDEYDALLVLDEIATGFGRTGALFACAHTRDTFAPAVSAASDPTGDAAPTDADGGGADYRGAAAWGVVPDVMCLGKALTGGYMTLGATLANRRVAEGISGGPQGGVFMHGPTFMGNPLACAAALASLELLQGSPWEARARNVGRVLAREMLPLAELDAVREVRVLGAIGVCELREPVKDMARVQHEFVQRGVWLRPFGKLLYTMPTFNCPELEEDHLVRIASAIREVAPTAAR